MSTADQMFDADSEYAVNGEHAQELWRISNVLANQGGLDPAERRRLGQRMQYLLEQMEEI